MQTQLFVCSDAKYVDFVVAIFGEGNVELVLDRIVPDGSLRAEILQKSEKFLSYVFCLS